VWVGYGGGHGGDANVWMSTSWVLKYSRAKAGEPMGEPRRQKPVVSLSGSDGPRILMLFALVE